SGLSDDEIKNMTKDAEAHAEEDKKKRQLIDLKNQADQIIYATEKTLKEHGDKVSGQTRGNIENSINSLKEAAKGEDGEAIKRSIENLNNAAQELGKVLYEEAAKKQASQAQPGQTAGPRPQDAPPAEDQVKRKGDDVIDAEFEAKG
ncbi:MAG: Hsp70 family protein, partial [Phycisphaerae bacterium]